MSKPVSERELLELQIKAYEFYAGLIDRAVIGGSSANMPKWDDQRAYEYQRLADELRARLAELDAKEADAPATEPGSVSVTSSPTSGTNIDATASPE